MSCKERTLRLAEHAVHTEVIKLLTLVLLVWKIWWAPSNASKWQWDL